MTLIVEDGRCPDFPNSYVSLENADAYLVGRGLWPATEFVSDKNTESSDNSNGMGNSESEDQAGEAAEAPGGGDNENEAKEKEEAGDSGLEEQPLIPDEQTVKLKEAALIRAFDFLNTLKWKGKKPCWERLAAWPRDNVPIPGSDPVEYIDPDLIPNAVIQAQCELAGLIYNGHSLFEPLEHGGKVKAVSQSKTETVDVLSESASNSVTYADNAPVETWLPSVYPLLAPFLEEIPGKAKSGFVQIPVLRG